MQSPTNEDRQPVAKSTECTTSPPNCSEDCEPCLQAQEIEAIGRPLSLDSERPEDLMYLLSFSQNISMLLTYIDQPLLNRLTSKGLQ